MKQTLETVVRALCELAGPEDMASVKINNVGNVFVSYGMHDMPTMNLDEFASLVAELIR